MIKTKCAKILNNETEGTIALAQAVAAMPQSNTMQDIRDLKRTMRHGVTVQSSSADKLTTQQREVLRKVEAMLTTTKRGK